MLETAGTALRASQSLLTPMPPCITYRTPQSPRSVRIRRGNASSRAGAVPCLHPTPGTVSVATTTSPLWTLAASTAGHLPAQIVGWVVIAGSCVRSVPQIMRITKNKSVEGISLLSFASELSAFLITIAYNVQFCYPLSTWGETLTNAVQHAVLVGLIFFYNDEVPPLVKASIVVGLTGGAAFLFSPMCTDAILRWLQSLVIVILAVFGRIPQVVLNWRRGNSGELSFGSTLLSVIGNVCRVYTTMALVKDPIIMATALSQLCLNSVLLVQIVDTIGQNKKRTGKLLIL